MDFKNLFTEISFLRNCTHFLHQTRFAPLPAPACSSQKFTVIIFVAVQSPEFLKRTLVSLQRQT